MGGRDGRVWATAAAVCAGCSAGVTRRHAIRRKVEGVDRSLKRKCHKKRRKNASRRVGVVQQRSEKKHMTCRQSGEKITDSDTGKYEKERDRERD